jgi:hypothetical protein
MGRVRLKRSRRAGWSALLVLGGLSLASGCGPVGEGTAGSGGTSTAGGTTRSAASAALVPLHAFLLIDVSRSVRQNVFDAFKREMAIELLVSRLQEDDEFFLVPIDNTSDDPDATSWQIVEDEIPGVGPLPTLVKVRDAMASLKQNPNEGSDFAGAIRYVSRNVTRINAENKPAQFLTLMLSDGEADKKQSQVGDKFPPGVNLHVIGPSKQKFEMSPLFKEVLEGSGVNIESLKWVAQQDWQSVKGNFAPEVGRPANEGFVRLLEDTTPGQPISRDEMRRANLRGM